MSTHAPLPFAKMLRYRAEAVPFFLFMGLFKILGVDRASALGGFIGRHIFTRLPAAKIAYQNLAAAYPEKKPSEIDAIVREHCDNLGRLVAEYAHLGEMTFGPGGRITIEGTEHAEAAIAAGKGVMFISGHFANWEVMPAAAMYLKYDGALVNRPPNNPYVAAYIARQRGLLGPSEQIAKGAAGTRRIFTLLRKGKSAFLLVDQKTYEGVPAPFFGRDAMTTPAPAALALKLGSALVPVSCERKDGAHFAITIHPAIAAPSSGDEEADILSITKTINAEIERIIRTRPSQWLWIHRRWTNARDIEKMQKMAAKRAG
ncbi:KDO2-lipid IV(A) lauroyltransferase [Rhizomicrobium palustre]|uniref:KDO2-lipid IV(A) lauroyltransferase n=1 Tax=Rhizomicrobium palustre TaxID=189966 RepID=A0A846N162_9PROT|nr:lysophospholipid acyltransferase family protein [Rhizomicrobium palustre]NIK89313.1 KDO2-lipid IV(A) lauroyltransferase [Rhizomicrobium palustre]